jgi:hypothetical protein
VYVGLWSLGIGLWSLVPVTKAVDIIKDKILKTNTQRTLTMQCYANATILTNISEPILA